MPLEGIAAQVGDIPATATLAAVRAIHTLARIEAVRYAGADRRLSNFGKKGARLATRDDYHHTGPSSAQATVYAVPPRVWAVVTDGAGPHVIGFGRASRNRRTGVVGNYTGAARNAGKRLRMPATESGWRMGPVFHPGTAGRGVWRTVRVRGMRAAREIFAAELHRAVN